MRVAIFRQHKGDPLCFAISALMRTGYSHAALEVEEGEIVEAFWPCVRRRKLDPSELPGIDFFEIAGLDAVKAQLIREYCEARIGAKARYSIWNFFRFLPWFRFFFGEAKDDGKTSAVFCSQFVFDALRSGGIPLFSALTNSWEVDPGHLAWSPLLIKSSTELALAS